MTYLCLFGSKLAMPSPASWGNFLAVEGSKPAMPSTGFRCPWEGTDGSKAAIPSLFRPAVATTSGALAMIGWRCEGLARFSLATGALGAARSACRGGGGCPLRGTARPLAAFSKSAMSLFPGTMGTGALSRGLSWERLIVAWIRTGAV